MANRTTNRTSDAITDASGVRAPDSKLRPLLLNDPDDGYADVNAPAMFDSPCPMNSWLPLIRWPDFCAIAREIDTASVRPSTVSDSAAGRSLLQTSGSKDGIDKVGRPDGSAPAVGTSAKPDCDSTYAN